MQHGEEEEAEQRKLFKERNDNRKKYLAFLEFRIGRMREELATVIYNTMNLVRKKQSIGYEEVEEE